MQSPLPDALDAPARNAGAFDVGSLSRDAQRDDRCLGCELGTVKQVQSRRGRAGNLEIDRTAVRRARFDGGKERIGAVRPSGERVASGARQLEERRLVLNDARTAVL